MRMRLTVWFALLGMGCGRGYFDERGDAGEGGASGDGADEDGAGPRICGAWTAPQHVPELSSASTDWGGSIASDGSRFYLSSDRVSSRDIYVASAMGATFATPTVVAAISDNTFDDFNPTTTGDEREIFFDSARVGGTTCIYTASRVDRDAAWGAVTRLDALCPATVSAVGAEISDDGLRLYYTEYTSGATEGDAKVATRTDRSASFGAGAAIPGLPSGIHHGNPTLSADELEVVFERSPPLRLWTAQRASRQLPFSTATMIDVTTSSNNEVDAELSADGTALYFASNRPGGFGSYDIYRSTRTCE